MEKTHDQDWIDLNVKIELVNINIVRYVGQKMHSPVELVRNMPDLEIFS